MKFFDRISKALISFKNRSFGKNSSGNDDDFIARFTDPVMTIRSSETQRKLNSDGNLIQSTNWVSLKHLHYSEENINYVYSHECRCNGKIVAFIPYRIVDGVIEVLIRNEATPCWNGRFLVPSSFTGGVDPGSTIFDTVVKELKEESGFVVRKEECSYLGQTFGSKSSDTIYYLFAIDLTGKDKTEELVSENDFEKTAHCEWIPINYAANIVPDAIFGILALRLIHMIMVMSPKVY